jgi:hypothetical protein
LVLAVFGVKPQRFVVLALSALLVAACFDATPDPPAIPSHKVDSKVFGFRESTREAKQQPSGMEVSSIAIQPPLYVAQLPPVGTQTQFCDAISLLSHAADSSPPLV